MRIALAFLLLTLLVGLAGCYRSPGGWDQSPTALLFCVEEFSHETRLETWFATPSFALFGDGTILYPSDIAAGKLRCARVTPEQIVALMATIKKAGFLDLKGIPAPAEPGVGARNASVWQVTLHLSGTSRTLWDPGQASGELTTFHDEHQELLLSLPCREYQPTKVRYAVGSLTTPTGDSDSGPISSAPASAWPLAGAGQTLADLAAQTQKAIAAGYKNGQWLSVPQADGAVARQIVLSARNDFEYPLVFTEGGKRYWLRWAPAIENPNAGK